MATKTHDPIGMPNSSPKIAADCVEVMKRYQDLGRDIEVLRDHLRSPHPRPGVAPRIAACMLTAATLEMALTRLLITAMSEEGEK